MSMIAMLSAKGAPGASTAVAALTTVWPHSLLVVDADPGGGDLLPGWLGQWWIDGWLHANQGVVSFAGATRHLDDLTAETLTEHVQVVPGARHARLLAGVTHPAQAAALGEAGWRRVAEAARALTDEGGPDVLVDAGRWSAQTPWPLIHEADLALLAVRPGLRHVGPTLPLVAALRETLPTERLGAAVCATTTRAADNMADALGLTVGLELPDDAASARVLSEGAEHAPHHRRSPLLRTATRAAARLHTRVSTSEAMATTEPAEQPVAATNGGTQ